MSNPIRIEQASPDDKKIILELADRLFKELTDDPAEFESIDASKIAVDLIRNKEKFVAFFAKNDDEIVGIITLVETFAIYAGGNYGVIPEMFIAPEYRSQGIGKQLVDAVKNYGAQKGWQRINVTAPDDPKWERTVKFYEREGFVFTGPKMRFMLND